MPNIELDLQIKDKKRFTIMCILLILLVLYLIIAGEETKEPYVAEKQSNVVDNHTTDMPTNNDTAAKPLFSPGLPLAENPFIEINDFDPEKQDIAEMATNGNSDNNFPSSHRGSIPLPAIPAIPALPIPPSYPGENSPVPGRQAISVAGISMDDSGNAIAIMSDGNIVSEGDNYMNDRIAYIGGDGLLFDNGEKLEYK